MIQKWKSRGSEKFTWGFSICDKVTRQFAHLIVLIIPQFRSTTLFSEEEPPPWFLVRERSPLNSIAANLRQQEERHRCSN
ncbi:MAG: hypothetical protein GX443_09755 [Deltaproteobacteria bacterium]|nr:hypothetical protein [Deltaproteobacteria bacterium]